MSTFVLSWLTAFAFTQMVEMGVYVHAPDRARPLAERLMIAFACSGITHPLVWFVIPELAQGVGIPGYWPMVAIAEAFAVLAETAVLACFGVRRAFLWSLGGNACSFTLGLFGYLWLRW